MLDIIFSPLNAISSALHEKSMGKTILVLIVTSLLAAINVFITTKEFTLDNLLTAIVIFIAVVIITIFASLLLQISLHILSQRGGYFEALTTLAYGFFILSFGYFIYSIVGLLPSSNSFFVIAELFLGGLILIFTFILANAVMLRAASALFQIDLFTVIIAFIIVYLAIIITVYMLFIKTLFTGLTGMPMF